MNPLAEGGGGFGALGRVGEGRVGDPRLSHPSDHQPPITGCRADRRGETAVFAAAPPPRARPPHGDDRLGRRVAVAPDARDGVAGLWGGEWRGGAVLAPARPARVGGGGDPGDGRCEHARAQNTHARMHACTKAQSISHSNHSFHATTTTRQGWTLATSAPCSPLSRRASPTWTSRR